MHSTTDDEWLFAISLLTLAGLLIITIWMVIYFVQYNKRYSQKKKMMDIANELLKPSKNGRSKKDHS